MYIPFDSHPTWDLCGGSQSTQVPPLLRVPDVWLRRREGEGGPWRRWFLLAEASPKQRDHTSIDPPLIYKRLDVALLQSLALQTLSLSSVSLAKLAVPQDVALLSSVPSASCSARNLNVMNVEFARRPTLSSLLFHSLGLDPRMCSFAQ